MRFTIVQKLRIRSDDSPVLKTEEARLAQSGKRVTDHAIQEMRHERSRNVEPHHLFLGVLGEGQNRLVHLLQDKDIDSSLNNFRTRIAELRVRREQPGIRVYQQVTDKLPPEIVSKLRGEGLPVPDLPEPLHTEVLLLLSRNVLSHEITPAPEHATVRVVPYEEGGEPRVIEVSLQLRLPQLILPPASPVE